jgi:CheY-like chemotaxis protein
VARVLVVDDVRFILQMIASLFEHKGHAVETAGDGEEALGKALGKSFDLIVTDVTMPKLDGLELARRLRADERTRDVPILLVTSRTDGGTLKAAVDIGVSDYLTKPFDSATLLAKSTALLGGYPMTFSLRLLGETAIVTALPEEMGPPAADHVKAALDDARAATPGPVLLDLSRASRVDVSVCEPLLAVADAFRRDGGKIELVRPRAGIGVRAFLAQITPRMRIHEDLNAARTALGIPAEAEGVAIAPPKQAPVVLSTAAAEVAVPHPAQAVGVTRMGAARGVVVEKHPQATIMRVTRPDLDADVFKLLHEELSRGRRALLVELPAILGLDSGQVSEIAALAASAVPAGASLRFVNPEAGVADALEAAGLGSLVLRTKAREPLATRSSS